MDIHYNAFISYRHHPEDIRVASEIHRSLEHYRVPRAIRKKTKGITRLFRDKEELPITSDLTTDITRALRNSDYLIVICSTHTKESTWVMREIETFLQTHDRSKVLTVLVNGEPYDTIPEILLYEEKTDPVTGQVEKIPIEPLSCDWRMPRRQARREELPRLAAALMGCGYNELRQRERQYRTQRMVTAFSVALGISLCFTAYFIHTSLKIQRANEQLFAANQQIRENLEQALENQSLFLANESGQLLEEGDRLTAMALALEALPESDGERPYVAAAELALAQALGAYESEGSIAAVGAMDCSAMVKDFKVSEDGRNVYILDARNVITVWDGGTLAQRGALELTFEPEGMIITPEGNLLVYERFYGYTLCCGADGTVLWRLEGCHDVALLGDRTMIALYREGSGQSGHYQYSIRFFSLETGGETREALELVLPREDAVRVSFLSRMNAGELPVALQVSAFDGVTEDIVVLEPTTGECTGLMTLEDSIVACTGFTAEGNLLFMTYRSGDVAYSRGMFLDMLTTGELTGKLLCLDRETGGTLWETEIKSYLPGSCRILETIPGSTDLMFLYENVFHVIDSATGQVITRGEASSAPLWAQVEADRTLYVQDDGSCGIFDYQDGTCGAIRYLEDELIAAHRRGDYYFAAKNLETQVVVYKWLNDMNCQGYEGNSGYISGSKYCASQTHLALESYGDLYVFHAEDRKLLWNTEELGLSGVSLLGFSQDGNTIWGVQDWKKPYELLAFNAADGTYRAIKLPEQVSGESVYFTDQYQMDGSELYFLVELYESDKQYLLRLDAETQVLQNWYICTPAAMEHGFDQKTVLLGLCGNVVLVWENSTGTIYEIDTAYGSVRAIAEGVESLPAAHADGDRQFVLAVNHQIQLRTPGMDPSQVIDLGDKRAGAVYMLEEEILALCDDGELYRYDLSGNQLSCTGLYLYTDFYRTLADDPSQVSWFFTEDGDLILDVCGMGNIVDRGTWQTRAHIPTFVGYDPVTDSILVNSSLSQCYGLASYPRYSTEDIISMAREALGDFRLSQEQKADYGLLEE